MGLPKQRKVGLDWFEFLCFESLTALFPYQHNSVPCDRLLLDARNVLEEKLEPSSLGAAQHLFPSLPSLPPLRLAKRKFSNCTDREVLFTSGVTLSLLHMPDFDSKYNNNNDKIPDPSGVSQEGPLGPGVKKDGCFRRLKIPKPYIKHPPSQQLTLSPKNIGEFLTCSENRQFHMRLSIIPLSNFSQLFFNSAFARSSARVLENLLGNQEHEECYQSLGYNV